jgi:hypothetical protein
VTFGSAALQINGEQFAWIMAANLIFFGATMGILKIKSQE